MAEINKEKFKKSFIEAAKVKQEALKRLFSIYDNRGGQDILSIRDNMCKATLEGLETLESVVENHNGKYKDNLEEIVDEAGQSLCENNKKLLEKVFRGPIEEYRSELVEALNKVRQNNEGKDKESVKERIEEVTREGIDKLSTMTNYKVGGKEDAIPSGIKAIEKVKSLRKYYVNELTDEQKNKKNKEVHFLEEISLIPEEPIVRSEGPVITELKPGQYTPQTSGTNNTQPKSILKKSNALSLGNGMRI